MLKDKIRVLMNTLGLTNDILAHYAGFNPTNISRLKNGMRIPSSDSPTIRKFCSAIEQYAVEKNCENLLYSITKERSLLEWLFEDHAISEDVEGPYEEKESSRASFNTRLDTAMLLADLSNAELGRAANIDPSSISRFRTGQRIPKSNNQIVHTICRILMDRITEKGLEDELASLISFREDYLDSDALFVSFLNWLCEPPHDNTQLIKELITNLSTFSPRTFPKLPALSDLVPEEILSETTSFYSKRKGLQQAVLRFLGNALISGTDRLLLYSDEPMSWLTEDKVFQSKWLALMALCIQKGIHIHVIHNIDRNISEMVEAIQSWMPLYLSGRVTSYYNIKLPGNRFCHTIFLCPDLFCISAFSATEDGDAHITWDYHTDASHVHYYDHIFQTLMKSSAPLVSISHQPRKDNDKMIVYQDVSIQIDHTSVAVTQLAADCISFTFSHPLMVAAFRAFVNTVIPESFD